MKKRLLSLLLVAILSSICLWYSLLLPLSIVKGMTGTGTALDPYMIYNLADLQAVRYMDMGAYYELANDIDASGTITMRGGAGLLPIGEDTQYDMDYREATSDNVVFGTWAQSVYNGGEGGYWGRINDHPAIQDTSYVTATSNGAYLTFGYVPFDIPAGSTHIGIYVTTRFKETAAGVSSSQARIRVGGAIYESSNYDPGDTNYLEVGSLWWPNNPATSVIWTVDEVNGVGGNALDAFGYLVTDATPNIRISYIYMTVVYIPPTPPSGLAFSGTFDGNGYTISGLQTWLPPDGSPTWDAWDSNQGLFGEITTGATIRNLTIEGDFYASSGTSGLLGTENGMLVGYANGTGITIDNCHVSGNFTSSDKSGSLIGYFNGEGTISNCTSDVVCEFEDGATTVGGLIGYLGSPNLGGTDANVDNCTYTGTINDASSVELFNVGGLVGLVRTSGTISNCSTSCDITAWSGSSTNVGGLIGYLGTGTVEDCIASGSVETAYVAGGLIGYLASGSLPTAYVAGGLIGATTESWVADPILTILTSYSTVDVISWYGNGVGGFVGVNGDDSIISECFSTGTVESLLMTNSVGGFVGENSGDIDNCYTRSSVTTGDALDSAVGGFVGYNWVGVGLIVDSYSTGLIMTPSITDIGGFCGDNDGIITDSYWDTQTSGYATSDGGDGEPTADMIVKTTFTLVGWNFSGTWNINGICNNSYPCLMNTTPLCPGTCVYNFIATPLSSSEIRLQWYDPNAVTTGYYVVIRSKQGGYPNDPPASDSKLVYNQACSLGNGEAMHSGLIPGTIYYYSIWFAYDKFGGLYTLCSQDFATTLAGPGGPTDPFVEPDEWFQDPTCDMYAYTPLMSVFNATANSYGMPVGSLCLICTMAFIGLAGAASYPLASRTQLAAPRTVVIPFVVVSVLVTVAAVAGALPLYFLFMMFILVGVSLFLWTRV